MEMSTCFQLNENLAAILGSLAQWKLSWHTVLLRQLAPLTHLLGVLALLQSTSWNKLAIDNVTHIWRMRMSFQNILKLISWQILSRRNMMCLCEWNGETTCKSPSLRTCLYLSAIFDFVCIPQVVTINSAAKQIAAKLFSLTDSCQTVLL